MKYTCHTRELINKVNLLGFSKTLIPSDERIIMSTYDYLILLTPGYKNKTTTVILRFQSIKHPTSISGGHEFRRCLRGSFFRCVNMKEPKRAISGRSLMLSLVRKVANPFFTEGKNGFKPWHVPSAFLRKPFEFGPDPVQEKTLTIYI